MVPDDPNKLIAPEGGKKLHITCSRVGEILKILLTIISMHLFIQTIFSAGKFSGFEQRNRYEMNGYKSNVSTLVQLADLAERK